MMHEEFNRLSGVNVTREEYEHIEAVYNACDQSVDKFTFIAMWRKLNAERVKAAKEKAKAQEKERKLRDRLFAIYARYTQDYKVWAIDALSNRDYNFLESLELTHPTARYYETYHKLRKRIGIEG